MHVGPWILEDVIAGGGFGKVYRARHRDGRRAAVKLLHAELASIREATARLLREVEAVRRIRHPAVVEVLDAGEEAGVPWYAMELLEGRDLHAVLEERGRLPLDETLAILEPVAEALACAHAVGIVHRDVKASNVFLATGRVVLLDFGVAKLLDADAPALTRSRQMIGTPSCMAPEQIAGRHATARTDVYALAGLAYRMLTGQACFVDESATMLSWLHLHARRPRPSRLAPLPPGIDEAIVRAMSIEPSARPPGPRELLAELRAAVAGPAVPAAGTRAVAVHVEVAADPATLIAPDERQVAALTAALAQAASELGGRGFRRAFETGTSALYVRELDRGEPEPAALAAADAAARALGPPLETRVRAGPLADLLRLDWV